jgi:hypothetical protein
MAHLGVDDIELIEAQRPAATSLAPGTVLCSFPSPLSLIRPQFQRKTMLAEDKRKKQM